MTFRVWKVVWLKARTCLIRDSLWFHFDSKANQPMIPKWVNHNSLTFDFWFGLLFIRRGSGFTSASWFTNKDKSDSKIEKNSTHRANQKFATQNESLRLEPWFDSKAPNVPELGRWSTLKLSRLGVSYYVKTVTGYYEWLF